MAIKIGDKFGKLTVLDAIAGVKKDGIRRKFFCRCDCGNTVWKEDKFLIICVNKTCGCHLLKNKDSKVCVACKKDKPKSEYHKTVKKASGIQSKCIKCMAKYKKERYWANRDAALAITAKCRLKPESIKREKEYYQKNKEAYQLRYKKIISNHKKLAKRRKVAKASRLRNKEKELQYKREYRLRPDVSIRLRLRGRLRAALIAIKSERSKCVSALKLVGCDIPFLKKHLEAKFTKGMTWKIFATGKIHIDHIKPCALFDLTKLEEQKKCFHYSNLQPLWGKDNISKGCKYDGD